MDNFNIPISLFEKLNETQRNELQQFVGFSEDYYTDESSIPDTVFDELEEKLISYQIDELTQFITTRIFKAGSGMESVSPETQEMISLKKIKYKDRSSIGEIKKFFGVEIRTQKIFYSPKLDGAALKITWDFVTTIPTLKKIITRGGLDVTDKFKSHQDILDSAKFQKTIITGELVCAKKVFNEKYSSENGGDYENARNFVGTLVKQNEIASDVLSDLSFIACTDGINPLNNGYWKELELSDIYNLEEYIQHYKSDNFPFLCDGIVLSFYENGPRRIKDNYPLNMVAIKFPGARARTKVIDFEYTQKKSGNLTPKALITPTPLEGSTMTKANCYNYQYLLDNHIGIGSIIEIEKSGDIIPIVAKVITRSNNIKMPECEFVRKGKHLVAVDMEESRRYKFILGLRLLNIDGIGDTLSEQIGPIVNYNVFDLFNPMYKPQICSALGGGDRWQKFTEIYNIKTLYLDNIIQMLQFNQVGPVIAKKIALLLLKKSNDITNIPGDVLTNVAKGEGFKRIIDVINYLKIHNIKILAPIEISDETITFEMSGEPKGMTKAQFVKELNKKYPNAVHTTLTKNTKYLFCDDVTSNSSKCNKSRKYNIKMLTYSDALIASL
jgi:DNA ligase (NAD+)